MAMHSKSDIENIFLRNKIRQQIQKGRKCTVNFLKEFLTYLGVVFGHGGHHLIGHGRVSERKK